VSFQTRTPVILSKKIDKEKREGGEKSEKREGKSSFSLSIYRRREGKEKRGKREKKGK
jgi:hypothetical protein